MVFFLTIDARAISVTTIPVTIRDFHMCTPLVAYNLGYSSSYSTSSTAVITPSYNANTNPMPALNPCFEHNANSQKGIVNATGLVNGKPVYNAGGFYSVAEPDGFKIDIPNSDSGHTASNTNMFITNTYTSYGAAYFNQWYNTDPNGIYNKEIRVSITLVQQADGSYLYASDTANSGWITRDDSTVIPTGSLDSGGFFPIDGEGFGNEGAGSPMTGGGWGSGALPNPQPDHNYSFTTEIHTLFTYDGTSKKLSFTGDDDIWVFINNKLVVDLGGTHDKLSATVDVSTLGLTPGQTYPLDIFSAERHTGGSCLKISTMVLLTAPSPITIGAQAVPVGTAAGIWFTPSATTSKAVPLQ